MSKSRIYIALYYTSLIAVILIQILTSSFITIFSDSSYPPNLLLDIANIILIIIFSIRLIKNKLKDVNIFFPILFLVFSIIVSLLAFIMNNKLVYPYIHFNYYITFILINYILLNIYSLLSFTKRK